jgi:hypothetical protein
VEGSFGLPVRGWADTTPPNAKTRKEHWTLLNMPSV